MEKQQAIEVLKPLVNSFVDYANITMKEEDDDIAEALEIAVDALKAQLSYEGTTKGATSDTISRQEAIDALDCINGVEEVLRSLPTIQPESSDKFIPPEQLAIKLGTATTRSAMQWIEFCNTLEFLGYAIVERRVK